MTPAIPATPATEPAKLAEATIDAPARILTHGLVGAIMTIAAAWLFFALGDEVSEHGPLVHFDHVISAWLQHHGTEPGETIFVGVSWFGAQLLIVLLIGVAIVLVAHKKRRRLLLLALASGGGALLNTGLKAVLHRHRPIYASEFKIDTWSFPSGHAMNSFIGYGLLAMWLARDHPSRKTMFYLAAAAVIGTIGYGRVYLGVHYPSDVIGGWAAGFVWLWITARAIPDRAAPESVAAAARPESAR